MRLRHDARRPLVLAGLAGLLALPLCAAGPASAAPSPGAAPGGWEPVHASSFTAAAGALCPFPLRSDVLVDRERTRTTERWADGSPRTQEVVGPLVVRLTDLASGRSVRRVLSARAVYRYAPGGGFDLELDGPAAVGFHPGDSLPPGYWVLTGRHVVRFAADGTRTLLVDAGSEQDVCAALA